MRAARRSDAGAVMDTIEIDAPGDSEALLAPTLVALGPDSAASATPAGDAWTPGAECVARVIEPPIDRADLAEARVVIDPTRVCGACDRCRSGLSAHCRERAVLGTPDTDGALCERLALPVANLVRIDDALADDHAVLALPVGRALHAAWLVHLEGRPYVTVLGGGVEAILAAQVMARLNASVRIITEHEATLSAADRLRLRHRRLDHVGQRNDQDVVVCTDPARECLATACAMVRPCGKIVLLATTTTTAPDPADVALMTTHEITLIGCRGSRLREAVAALGRGEIACDGLITQRYPFHRADAAIRAATDPASLRIAVEM